MNRNEVTGALITIRDARRAWDTARAKFISDVDAAMMRLINEAAANFMSAEDVAKFSGFTVKRVRQVMRQNTLNPKVSRKLLARDAARTLNENATVMGIEPRDMDLMSPLAYLPAGKDIRGRTSGTLQAEVFPETDIVCTVPGCNCDIDYRARQA